MTLCVNNSGTWRKIKVQCVNNSGTWRYVEKGCVNKSGTWRCFGFYNPDRCSLGSNIEGGYLICKSSSVLWIVSPSSAQVSTNWHNRASANTKAQQVSGCTGWFIPTVTQAQNPGYKCRTYWDSYSSSFYWTNTQVNSYSACIISISAGSVSQQGKNITMNVRSFRCVTY